MESATISSKSLHRAAAFAQSRLPSIADGRYTVRFAENWSEVESALRLRYAVFRCEMGDHELTDCDNGLEFDEFDLKCLHLIVVCNETGLTVGTYRLNSMEDANSWHGFYSAREFKIEDLPPYVLRNGIEIGRACIAPEHRNTKVLFLLWKSMMAYLEYCGKRYFFGCCSIFTRDPKIGRKAYRRLVRDRQIHDHLSILPCKNGLSLLEEDADGEVELPALFNMYLRLGARVCGPPSIDRQFGTIDFFVVLDVRSMTDKYHRMFTKS